MFQYLTCELISEGFEIDILDRTAQSEYPAALKNIGQYDAIEALRFKGWRIWCEVIYSAKIPRCV